MAEYTVYPVNNRGARLPRCYTFNAPNDGAAEEFVRQRQTDQTVELWHGGRLVARFGGSRDDSTSSIWL